MNLGAGGLVAIGFSTGATFLHKKTIHNMIIPVMSLEKFVALLDERIDIGLRKNIQGNTKPETHEYLSAKATAQLLGISTVSLRRYTREGIITGAYRIKNVVKYRRDEVEKSLQAVKAAKYSRRQQF